MQKTLTAHFRFIAFFLLSFTVGPAVVHAQAEMPDAIAFSNISRGVKCQLVKEITALPEWRPFVDAFTKKIDAEYVKAEQKPGFPKQLADMFLDKVRQGASKTDISSRDVIDLIIENWEAFVLSVWLVDDTEKPIEASIMLVVKFDPKELESFLSFVPGNLYNALESKTADKLYQFRHDGKEIYAGYAKIPSRDSFAISVSEKKNRVERTLEFAKSDSMKQGILSDSGPIKKGVLPSTFFEKARDFLAEKAREQTKGNPDAENLIKILENIDRIQYTVEDVSDATVSKLLIAMKNEDEAKNLKEMAEGFIALLKFLSTYGNDIDEIGKHAIAFITQIQIEQNGNSVSASCRSNSPELRAALKSLFAKVTEDLK